MYVFFCWLCCLLLIYNPSILQVSDIFSTPTKNVIPDMEEPLCKDTKELPICVNQKCHTEKVVDSCTTSETEKNVPQIIDNKSDTSISCKQKVDLESEVSCELPNRLGISEKVASVISETATTAKLSSNKVG